MDISQIDALRSEFSLEETRDEHFKRCWSHQNCNKCLASSECSWCPFTWTCVPNSYSVPFLAPFSEGKMCPAKEERWELRTRPLGCGCSTTTTLGIIASVAGTLLVMALAFIAVLVAVKVRRRLRALRRARGDDGWGWPPSSSLLSPGEDAGGGGEGQLGREREQEPLLRQRRGAEES